LVESPSLNPVPQPAHRGTLWRWLLAWPVLLLAAAVLGAACALAGRIVLVVGLYDVVAALLLGAGAVALLHLLGLQPGRWRWPLAVAMAAVQAAALLSVDAWGAWRDQVRWVEANPEMNAEDLLVAGVDEASALVDLGLQAATGHGGAVGAWLQQWQAGLVVHRGLDDQRVWPLPTPIHAGVLGAEWAFVALLIARSLQNLQNEPRCQRCGAYLQRQVIARLSREAAQQLAERWAAGDLAEPQGDSEPVAALVYRDHCAAGHSVRPGLALVALRRRGWSGTSPGPWASIPPQIS
jgi:hypothetical protein